MHSSSQRGLDDRKYGQLCQSLLDLELAAENIFTTITNRVSLEHHRLEALKGRIQVVQTQVNFITGTNRAITVFSSSKYPAIPTAEQDFIPLFGGKVGESYSEFPSSMISLSSGQSQNGGEGTSELYRFFTETSCESWLDVPEQKGIGSLPPNLRSVVDALLFNTVELPYFKYQIIDNLLVSEKLSVQERALEPIILPPPPQSVLDCSAVRSAGSEDFGFRPVLGQVPSFTLPSVLPDLPMIAEISWSGLNFGIESLPSIAPSALPKDAACNASPIFMKYELHTPRRPNQHAATSRRIESLQTPSQPSLLSQPQRQQSPQPQPQPQPQPPPPPPLPTPPAVPPAPPLPIFPVNTVGSVRESKIFSASEQFSSVESSSFESFTRIDSQRAALLASIRNPNVTLRKVEEKSEVVQPLKGLGDFTNEASTSRQKQPGNLLSEMATALKMRRLSMQGAAQSKEQDNMKLNEKFRTLDDTSSPSRSSGNFTLPASLQAVDMHPYVAKSDESDSEDEWDD